MTTKTIAAFMAVALAAGLARATDYYVAPAPTGSDDNAGTSADAPFETIDKAISTAVAGDNIYVSAGTYSTTTQYGPNLAANLIGTGATRGDVVIQSAGAYRTLRMAANSWLENVTIVGIADISKVDKGGAIEMNGGTITNCVVRDGTAKGNDSKNAGGNLYVNSDGALVVDCEISGGMAKCRGGNVCLDHGTLRNCTITGGTTSGGSEQNNGGNVWTYQGKIENCTISGGSAVLGGNVFIYNANASLAGGTISGGTATQYGGNVYLREGAISKATVSGGFTTTTSGNYGGGNIYAEGNAVVSECVILDGSAYRRGGNVYAVGGATVKDCAITNGTCSANIGGNIYMEAATVTNSIVYGGSAPAGRGGNIFLNYAASLVTDCTIENGNAGTQGGNIYVNAGAVCGSTIANGTSVTEGGNVFMAASTVVSDCVISNGTINSTNSNWDGPKGVNVNLNGASAKLLRCHVIGGTTTPLKDDGSFYYERGSVAVNNSSAQIDNCLVEGSACGGVVMQSNGYLYNSTIVKNGRYGYWAWNANQHVYNTVIYGNTANDANVDYTGNMPNGDSAAFLNNAVTESGSRHTTSAYPTVVLLSDDSAFTDYANGNYVPTATSALVDAGATDARADASTSDLLGNPRTSGQVDIGCYEFQKSEMTVSFAYAEPLEHQYAPVTASFTVAAQNVPSGQTPTFTIDFGDGTEPDVTTESALTHAYAQPGVYTITVTVSAPGTADATMTYQDFVSLSSQTIYVTKDNANAAFPYNTPETGYASFAAALADAVDGGEIRVGDGVYEQTAKQVVNKGVTICGNLDNPGAVVLCNTATAASGQGDKRVMSIDNANALVCGLTLQGGQVYHGNGGNLTISAGMISNCVIRGGVAYAGTDAEYGMGAGVAISGSGVVSHCAITNNEVRGEASGKWVQGGAVVFPWGSSGKLLHSLVAGNRWVVESDTANGTAGILYHGSTSDSRVESCTVVANEIVGTCGPSCAAGIRCDWNSVVRNTAIAGNRIGAAVSNVFLAQDGDTWKDGLNNCVTEDALPSGNASCSTATVNEMFRNYANGDYRPKTKGALYDKGIDLLVAVSVDLAGKPRVFGKAIDIGCYESQMKAGFSVVIR